MEGELQRVFGANVRRIRLDRGLSQEELAEVLDLHRTFVGGVERGERNLTLRTVEWMCDQLGAEPLDLLAKPAGSERQLRAAADGRDPGARPKNAAGWGKGSSPRRH